MEVLFCTSQKPGAVIIRAVTWSDWSHVAIVDGDMVIEAVWPEVKVTPLAEVIAAHTRHEIVAFPCGNDKAVIAAARSQIGKPYDLAGILGVGLHRDWQDEGSWWCSELVAWAKAKGDAPWFRDGALRRVVPQHIYMLAPQGGTQ